MNTFIQKILSVLGISIIVGSYAIAGDASDAPRHIPGRHHIKNPDPLMQGRMSHIIGVNHVGITVSDITKSREFYEKTTFLSPIKDFDAATPKGMPALGALGDKGTATMLQGPNSFLKLMSYGDVQQARGGHVMPVQGPGITHICFMAPKAKPLDANMIAHGATWQSSTEAMVDMRGVGFMYGYLRDPDGVMLELEHAPKPKINGDVWLGHVAIATPDLTKTLAFYEKLLGYKSFRRVDNLGGPTFGQVAGIEGAVLNGAWFRISDYYNLEFWQFSTPKTQQSQGNKNINQLGYNSIVFETTDIAADFARIQAAGIKPETNIIRANEIRSFYVRDLDGNLLAFTEFKPGSELSLTALK